jgi:hypothetical protein
MYKIYFGNTIMFKDLTKGYSVLYICEELLTVRSLIEMPLALCLGKLPKAARLSGIRRG